ncbi:MAG: hypothetical protein CMG35_04785 [Candidatus Marinimicrobia bacterium]|nr:hypothetical protein [Candidatus Neomarinimicrobiota bacterium]|tara:strand:- start:4782 stop:5498 length:717 start_codon:yes stop_codon:yes gene_type:complete
MRDPSTIKKLQDRMSPAYCISNFLTEQNLSDLYSVWLSTQDSAIEKNTGPITVNLKDIRHEKIIKDVIQKIKNEIGEDCECWGGQFFYTNVPYVVHNDDDIDRFPNAYKAFSMPIKVWPEEKESSLTELILFEQSYFNGPAKFFKGGPIQQTYYNVAVYDYKDVKNIKDIPIPKAITNKLLPHLKSEWLQGLSIDNKFSWQIGDAIVFDSLKLHASTDFRKKGIQSKLGLSLFFEKAL